MYNRPINVLRLNIIFIEIVLYVCCYLLFYLITITNIDLHNQQLLVNELSIKMKRQYPTIVSRTNLPRTEEAQKIMKGFKNYAATSDEIIPISLNPSQNRVIKRARCNVCPSSFDNKTNIVCELCKKHLCKNHVIYICINCKQ